MSKVFVMQIMRKQALRDRTNAADRLHSHDIRTLEHWTDPLGCDWCDWPEEHRESYGANILSTLACRQIRSASTPGERTIESYVRAHVRVAGIEQALIWLDEFRKETETFGPTKLIQEIAMMSAELPGHCICSTENHDTWWHSPVLIWIHDHHRLYNQAMWEIMAKQPGLIRRLRRALRDDLRFPDRTIGDDQVFGRHLDKPYSRQLLSFITPQLPDPKWIGPHGLTSS